MGIIDYALRNRAAVFTLIMMIVTLGLRSYLTLPRESSPDVTVPFAYVSTFYFGTSPEDMENLITEKLETSLSEIENIKEMRSMSGEGLSSISIELTPMPMWTRCSPRCVRRWSSRGRNCLRTPMTPWSRRSTSARSRCC